MKPLQFTSPKRIALVFSSIIIGCASSTYADNHSSTDVANAAQMLGLDAANLACVGVTNTEINTVFDALDEEYDVYEQIITQYTAQANAQQSIADANARLRLDGANAQAQADLQSATAAEFLASSSITQLRASLLGDVLDGTAESSLISPILLDQGAISRLPSAYRLAVDTVDEAKTLQWALKLETRVNANGGTLPSEADDAIDDARAQIDYNTAKVRIETYSAANQTAIDNWVGNH
jgi:hypothetical protein